MKKVQRQTGSTNEHTHAFDDTVQSGRTSSVSGHDHSYSLDDSSTGPGGGGEHTHSLPSIAKQLRGSIVKVDEVKKVVYGWAYVCEEGGQEVIDHSGDVIAPEELEKAAHQFVTDCRIGKVMHAGETQAEMVESVFFSKELQEALDIDLGKVGWFVGFSVSDPDIIEKISKGELSMFSIGGTAIREAIDNE